MSERQKEPACAFKHADLIRRTYGMRWLTGTWSHQSLSSYPGSPASGPQPTMLWGNLLSLACRWHSSVTRPMDRRFWSTPSFLEWTCDDARLACSMSAERQRDPVRFRCCPISLIQRSIPVDGEFNRGGARARAEDEADYKVDVAGKLVLTNAPVARVQE